MAPCPHLAQAGLKQPPSNLTRPEECSQCFDNQDSEQGVDICLGCFNGACPRVHAQAHADKFGAAHSLAINIKRVRKPTQASTSPKRLSGEPPLKKLAIREEPSEREKYDFVTAVKCYACGGGQTEGNEQTDAITKTLLSAMTTAKQSEVKAWEQELQACRHTLDLTQLESKHLAESGLAHCSSCELTQNLWLCLTCGNLNCGRQQFGGLGGNGHAVAHYTSSGHPVSVKLGTIQPDGTADIYCYACDDEKLDPKLALHLKHFGIQVESQVKTEKSLSELQVEQNMKFDFAMSGEDGKQLEPLFGPGLTGLRNLGNSCYIASVLQVVFSLPTFSDRYFTKGTAHTLVCQNTNPATCFECQMSKIADGLLSGRYSVPRPDTSDVNDDATAEAYAPEGGGQGSDLTGRPVKDAPAVPFQEGIRPIMFKTLVGKDHPEFSTMRQQDSEEFFKYLVNLIQKTSPSKPALNYVAEEDIPQDPTDSFKFQMQERLQCDECKGVRYKSVQEESVSMPVPFIRKDPSAPHSSMDLDVKGKGSAEGIVEATGTPTGADGKTEFEPVAMEECLRLLTSSTKIEYRCPRCKKNVIADKSTKFETFPDTLVLQAKKFTLVNWVPQKVDVPLVISDETLSLDEYRGMGKTGSEVELPEDEAQSQSVIFDEAAMSQLEGMGFPPVRCQKALLATGNADAEAAMNWLFAHMEDPDIDAPIPAEQLVSGSTPPSKSAGPSTEAIAMVADMGFSANQARKALVESSGNIEAAVEWLFSNPDDAGIDEAILSSAAATPSEATTSGCYGSPDLPAKYRLKAFISHKGNSIHVGHYVAHIHEPGVGWVLFNDEKVVKAEGGAQSAHDLMPFAYLYIFEKLKGDVSAQ